MYHIVGLTRSTKPFFAHSNTKQFVDPRNGHAPASQTPPPLFPLDRDDGDFQGNSHGQQ